MVCGLCFGGVRGVLCGWWFWWVWYVVIVLKVGGVCCVVMVLVGVVCGLCFGWWCRCAWFADVGFVDVVCGRWVVFSVVGHLCRCGAFSFSG